MPKRKSMICELRRDGKYPNGHITRFIHTDEIALVHKKTRQQEKDPEVIMCSQATARLFAKRINQFIDEGG